MSESGCMKIISLRQKTALQNWVLGLLWKYQDVSNTSQSFTFSFIRAALQRPDARLRNLLLPWNFTTVKYLLGVAPYSGSEIYFVYDQICKCKIVLSETPSHSLKSAKKRSFVDLEPDYEPQTIQFRGTPCISITLLISMFYNNLIQDRKWRTKMYQ